VEAGVWLGATTQRAAGNCFLSWRACRPSSARVDGSDGRDYISTWVTTRSEVMDVSVRELKARLSEYLRRVQQGEQVTITQRGKPVGRLVPPEEPPELDESEIVRTLLCLPWIRPGTGGTPLGARDPLPHRPGEKTLAEIVSETRG
jgi:prevent-host-death family protein